MSHWFPFRERKSRPKLRLFCLPHAGGSASTFRWWMEVLPREIEVIPVQLPGRETRITEPPFTRLEPLVEGFVGALAALTDVPFAVFGHSMGALIAFETTRLLACCGGPMPIHLFASGHRAPHRPSRFPPIHGLPEAALKAHLSALNGTPREVLESPEFLDLLVPLMRADLMVCETYVYTEGPRLPVPIAAYSGRDDTRITIDEALAWREQTRTEFSFTLMQGDHFFVRTARSALLRSLRGHLRDERRSRVGSATSAQH